MPLFLKVGVPSEVQHLRNNVILAIGHRSERPFVPHISLAYSAASSPAKKAQTDILESELRELKFSLVSLDIIYSADDIPISEWKKISS